MSYLHLKVLNTSNGMPASVAKMFKVEKTLIKTLYFVKIFLCFESTDISVVFETNDTKIKIDK